MRAVFKPKTKLGLFGFLLGLVLLSGQFTGCDKAKEVLDPLLPQFDVDINGEKWSPPTGQYRKQVVGGKTYLVINALNKDDSTRSLTLTLNDTVPGTYQFTALTTNQAVYNVNSKTYGATSGQVVITSISPLEGNFNLVMTPVSTTDTLSLRFTNGVFKNLIKL